MVIKCISIYLFVGVIFLSVIFANSFIKGKSSYASLLGLLSLALQVYLLGYLMELNSESLERMIFWNKVQYLAIPFSALLWFGICMVYTGRSKFFKSIGGVCFIIFPVITVIVRMTNDWHHLFYNKIDLRYVGGMKLLLLGKGPWYLVFSGYMLMILILNIWFYIQRYRRSEGTERMQFRLLLSASVLLCTAMIFCTVNIGGIGIDYMAFAMPNCILLIHLALTRYNFLEIKILGRERVFEESATGLILLNNSYLIVDYNEAGIMFFQWFQLQIGKEKPLDLLLKDQAVLLESIKSSENKVVQLTVMGEPKYVDVNIRSVQHKKEKGGFLLTFEDVTERELLKQRLITMANMDELSGLNNRRRFRECAIEAIQHAQSNHGDISVLMMDIDNFKIINDTYGHMAGDAVIKEFSQILREIFIGMNIVGRMGGEEFAVVMPDADAQKAGSQAEHFRQVLERKKVSFGEKNIGVTVSIGVAQLNQEAIDFDGLLNSADNALYEAKRSGRNRTVVAETEAGEKEQV